MTDNNNSHDNPSKKSTENKSAEQPELPETPEKNSPDDKKSTAAAKPEKKQKAPDRKKSAYVKAALRWLLLLILLSGLAAAGYYGWQSLNQLLINERQDYTALEEQLAEQERQLQAMMQEVTAAKEREQSQVGKNDEFVDQLAQLQRRVTSHGSRLRELSTATREDWLLAEAEYLLRLANQRLLTERSTQNPVALLKTADEILSRFDDPELFAVRKQLAEDITALQLAGVVDREGLYLQLTSLSEVIPELQLLVKPWDAESVALADPESVPESGEKSWSEKLADSASKAWEGMQGYVRIRHRDHPVEPLLSPDEEVYLRQNLTILLEQAQLALLREEPAIYQTSLNKCATWLKNYFQLNQPAQVFQERIVELEQQNIVQKLPNIAGSLEALRNYINLWHLRHQAPAKPEAES
ncbi:uroporphyrinogen-III C-methyltransferase [Porticoccaceae bacterium LTM1]|nr:uroporphyrinogen-III C-methyltransferase [Porticoccaceae bacterium LTM1]